MSSTQPIRINVFDITDDMLDALFPVRPQPKPPPRELRLVRGYVRAAAPPRRDSYGIRCDRPRPSRCSRCGIGYTAANPRQGDDTCRDCTEVIALIN